MENTMNSNIGCNVKECKFNVEGCNCGLDHIHVGGGCGDGNCTCCDSFKSKV